VITAIDRLMKGDRSVADDFVKAKVFWSKFFTKNGSADQKDSTEAINWAQTEFELMLGMNRDYAQQLMPWTCFASLYDETNGFEDDHKLATHVFRAFQQSGVSLGVKSRAKDAAQVYGVDE
jgi:hypothetical protein